MTRLPDPATPPARAPEVASGMAPVMAGEAFPIGAHLVTPRRGYTHHGIHVGNGRVVHYAGLSRALLRGPVEEVTLERFAGGAPVSLKADAPGRFTPAEVVARARSRLGENRYRIATNNCEHFCAWCVSGEGRSEQVERVLGWARTALAAVGRAAAPSMSAGRFAAQGA